MSRRWTFVIDEVSGGCYRCEAIRDTHHSVRRDGFESAIPQLLRDAFEMELQLGTPVEEAAFHITSGFKYLWRNEYHPKEFGSWLVASDREPHHAIYNGEESHLALYLQDGPPVWQGHIGTLKANAAAYFEELSRL